MDDIEIFTTQDGSLGLYNKKMDEVYHSKFGAKTESFEKFIEPCLIINNKPLEILDICYGIGYNTKCAIENFNEIKSIDCVETDKQLVNKSPEFEYDVKINKIIEKNLKNPDFIHFYIEDIRKFIKRTNKKYDIIFHDGFSPHKQSEVWSEELIFEIVNHLKPDGLYSTYNHSKPVLKALLNTGIKIGKTIKNNKTIATVASYNEKLILNPLDDYDLGMLETKSAITYKDKDLNLTHCEILLNRQKEITSSNLITLSKYKKLIQSSGSRDNFG